MGGAYTYSAVTVVHVYHTFMSLLNFTELNSTAICQNKCKQACLYYDFYEKTGIISHYEDEQGYWHDF